MKCFDKQIKFSDDDQHQKKCVDYLSLLGKKQPRVSCQWDFNGISQVNIWQSLNKSLQTVG